MINNQCEIRETTGEEQDEMTLTMIITCGTSLLTNYAKGKKGLSDIIRHNTNFRSFAECSKDDKRELETAISDVEKKLAEASLDEAKEASAELNGVISYYGGDLSAGKNNMHYLLCSDTAVGEACAKIANGWLAEHGLITELVKVPDLTTASKEYFPEAMGYLAHWCSENISALRGRHHKVIFNLVGGFKAFLGFMQTLGMLYADETVYTFEGTNELLTLPSLPISLNAGIEKFIEDNMVSLRFLSDGGTLSQKKADVIPRLMVSCIDGENTLSQLGDIVFTKYCDEHFGEKLFPSPLPENIIYTEQFLKSIECETMRDKTHMKQLNERIDDLARYILTGANTKRFDLKKLAGKPVADLNVTHEIDLWSTGGGWRLFCHCRDGNVWFLDMVHKHL